MNREYITEGGPLFILIGGEWRISPGIIQQGHVYDMARNLSALMIYTEHRYYGFSSPTPNLEMDNLQWLNVDQALADLAHFIAYIKETMPEVRNSGVILFGCSYSGSIATWFMQKYPHIAQGAWATGAPLLAVVDFKEYNQIVSEAIHSIGGSDCSGRIERAMHQMENLFFDSQYDELGRIFRLCHPLNATNQLDVWSLFAEIGGSWKGLVQMASRRGQEIERNCERFLSIEGLTDVEAYAQWAFELWGLREEDCFDNRWSSILEIFNGTEWTDIVALVGARQWLYQVCSAFGYKQSSNWEYSIFGSMIPAELYLQLCVDLYNNE